MGYITEIRQWIDESIYFRVHYAAQPFARVRDTGHAWEILFAPGKGPKNPGTLLRGQPRPGEAMD